MTQTLSPAAAEFAAKTSRPPTKQTDADRAVADKLANTAKAQLQSIIDRMENLAAQKADLTEDQKVIMAEAKGQGFDTKTIRRIIALRKRDPNDVAEEDAIFDMYRATLGI